MKNFTDLTEESLRAIAEKVNGKLWMKGDKIRIYVTGGNNYHYDGSWYFEIAQDGAWEAKCYLTAGYSNANREEYVNKHLATMDEEMEAALGENEEVIMTDNKEVVPISESEEIKITMSCEPVAIVANEHYDPRLTPVRFVANLSGTKMIDSYKGCGSGIAYVRNNKVVAFRYGRATVSNEPNDAKRYFIDFSCTQICFNQRF